MFRILTAIAVITLPYPITTVVAPSASACLAGQYQSTDGSCVPGPSAPINGLIEGGPPPGATAICRDGNYSYSHHRSGTCSSHGGVREFIGGN
ncbi:anchored-membrane serine/threonine-protein kinase PknF [Mycobacteroides abscessus subsp. abscessus]|uniref:Anchored-membrane serine/threonine-protein kinase PknF n=1 Tax=Mycobacteroides abscessus TaxID=36809 RepID=A0AB33SWE1_9MYCO|nr:DUF3761 domain-containing protein [Mycobacteroides abscessus]MDO3015302.1 DUF3761 domain-containing protein [Mycobacteroides abscessus subsp. abscessus]MDO3085855.1 DUF3761 domain-containing protein [Mycobacteroides abscessus subsp. abscessus]MDO3315774.1 DUF3761 domain-containing protein [Mycobacteroides abscessus subsp. abscessus]MDO3343045.1 DUF3761 domain-containing protein [Mycobacteroides abscessus subsp. abscessus]PVB17169.1 DUF3761 domain-containing protein [Mycobacteroides abscessu